MCGSVRPFSERVEGLATRRPNHQFGAWRAKGQNLAHILWRDGNAAGSRTIVGPCKVEKDGTTAALNAGALVVAGFNDNVVEVVSSPQLLVGGRVGHVNHTVVVPVPCRFTPAPALPELGQGQAGSWPDQPVTAVVPLLQGPNPGRAGAIAFHLKEAAARPPK